MALWGQEWTFLCLSTIDEKTSFVGWILNVEAAEGQYTKMFSNKTVLLDVRVQIINSNMPLVPWKLF